MPESFTIFFDLETAGLQPSHPSIQLAAIAIRDSDWAEMGSFEAKLQFDESKADPEALRLNHYDPATWKEHAVAPSLAVAKFSRFCEPYRSITMLSKRTLAPYSVAKLAGHNAVNFDLPRLRELFGVQFFPFSYHVKDTLQRALWFFDEHSQLARPENLKLTTLCAHFGLKVSADAHDALVDVRLSAALARAIQVAERGMEMVHA